MKPINLEYLMIATEYKQIGAFGKSSKFGLAMSSGKCTKSNRRSWKPEWSVMNVKASAWEFNVSDEAKVLGFPVVRLLWQILI
jgi:hypothetical protein